MNSVVCVRVCAPGVLRADGAHPRISRLALHRRKLAQREEANGPGTTLLALPTSLHLIRVWSDGRSSSSDSSGEPCGDKKRRRSRRSKRNRHRSDDDRDAGQPSQPLHFDRRAFAASNRPRARKRRTRTRTPRDTENHLLLVVLLQTVVIIALRVGERL